MLERYGLPCLFLFLKGSKMEDDIFEEIMDVYDDVSLDLYDEYYVEIKERRDDDYDPISSGVSWFLDSEV